MQSEGVDERLGNRLDRERHDTVAHAVAVAVHCCHGNPEGIRVGMRKLRDIGGNRSAAIIAEPTVQLAE